MDARVILICLFLCGCAEQPTLTARSCIVSIAKQVAPNAFMASLICNKEEPYKEEQ